MPCGLKYRSMAMRERRMGGREGTHEATTRRGSGIEEALASQAIMCGAARGSFRGRLSYQRRGCRYRNAVSMAAGTSRKLKNIMWYARAAKYILVWPLPFPWARGDVVVPLRCFAISHIIAPLIETRPRIDVPVRGGNHCIGGNCVA